MTALVISDFVNVQVIECIYLSVFNSIIQTGGGGLGRLVKAVGEVVGDAGHTIEVVSVYNLQNPSHTAARSEPHHTTEPDPRHSPLVPTTTTTPDLNTRHADPSARPSPLRPSTCVWVSVREEGRDRFMDPVKLQGLLGLHTFVVSSLTY